MSGETSASTPIEEIASVDAEHTTPREVVTGSILGIAALSSLVLIGAALATFALYTFVVVTALFSAGG